MLLKCHVLISRLSKMELIIKKRTFCCLIAIVKIFKMLHRWDRQPGCVTLYSLLTTQVSRSLFQKLGLPRASLLRIGQVSDIFMAGKK